MPSVSKSQQRFFSMVKKCKETGDCASDKVEKAAQTMTKKDITDFAKTNPKGLPEKIEKNEEEIKEIIRRVVAEGKTPDAPNHAHYATVMSHVYDLETDFHSAWQVFQNPEARKEGAALEEYIKLMGDRIDRYFEKYMDEIDLN